MSNTLTNLGTEPCRFCNVGKPLHDRLKAKRQLTMAAGLLRQFLEDGAGTLDLRRALSTAVDAMEAAQRANTAIGTGLHPGCSRCGYTGEQDRLEWVSARLLKEGDLVDLEGDRYADPDSTDQQFPFELVEVCGEVRLEEALGRGAIAVVGFEANGEIGFPLTWPLRVACPEATLCLYCDKTVCERHDPAPQDIVECGAHGKVHGSCHEDNRCPNPECWEDPDRAYEIAKERRLFGDD